MTTGEAGADRLMRVRVARPENAEALAAFAARVFHETYDEANEPENVRAYVAEHFTAERHAAEIRDPATDFLLGEIDGVLAAYAKLRRVPPDAPLDARAPMEIARFYVDAPWHGRGLAHELMDAVAAHAAGAGCDVLWLGVWKENARAVRFYQKQGFEIAGTLTFRMGEDVQEDHLMVRPLAG